MQAVSLRYIKNRIRAVEGIKKLTHAIEMVSMSKSKAVENILAGFKGFSANVDSMLDHLLSSQESYSHPLLEKKPLITQKALCLITSDTGLCGTYNNTIIRKAEEFIKQYGKENVRLITVGKKGFSYFSRKGVSATDVFLELHGRYSKTTAGKILATLLNKFLSNDVGEVYIAYTKHISATRRTPVVEKFLNIEPSFSTKKTELILEPNFDKILDKLLLEYLSGKIKIILLNAYAAEHSARLIAMGEATTNAKELLESLILQRNKLRQSTITSQLLEIVSSAEAMKG
ncbi:MAG: ATP synthase F1 subunit gamma [Candidatus Omnitrophica bacterium]|nr:ATP synthase F1 subunit gamma [Candidatus Omnitrophota bacterium]